MRAVIAAKLLASKAAQPLAKPFEIYDTRLPGFTLRVQPSGIRSYYARLGRSARVALGKVGELTADEARERCQKVLGNVAHGRLPFYGLDGADSLTLSEFIEHTYAPWLQANRQRSAANTLEVLKRSFSQWHAQPLTAITLERIESWKTRCLNEGLRPTSVLRYAASLSGVLSRAVKLGKLADNPFRRMDNPRIDRSPKVRYLDTAEEKRLREALRARDTEMRAARVSANKWRRDRKQEPLATLPHYGDHLTPAVLVSINTGLRRGELLALRWSAVDTKEKQLTIEGSTAKNLQTRHIPLNSEALDVLKRWKEQAPGSDRIFSIDTSFKSAWAPLLVRAKIKGFRWHDLRHHFASRLAQVGVPLNTIRELLGHGSLAMTLRYAHLAPDQRAAAVALLNAPPESKP